MLLATKLLISGLSVVGLSMLVHIREINNLSPAATSSLHQGKERHAVGVTMKPAKTYLAGLYADRFQPCGASAINLSRAAVVASGTVERVDPNGFADIKIQAPPITWRKSFARRFTAEYSNISQNQRFYFDGLNVVTR